MSRGGDLFVSGADGRRRLGGQGRTFDMLAFLLLLLSFLCLPSPLSAAGFAQTDSTQDNFTCDNVDKIPVTECEILAQIYTSTNGDKWINNEGWLQTNNPCDWYGIECDQSDHVTRIFLDSNQLSGPIPPELGDLSELIWLQLNDNQLSGSIPPRLGQLTNVTWLRLETNQLSGPIPPELGNMVTLQSLYLSGNELSGSIPPELGKLPDLLKLYLGETELSGEIPSELGNLSTLEFLLLGDTELSGPLPQTFRNLESLRFFHLLGTDLCEPANDVFQAWIEGVEELFGDRTRCPAGGPIVEPPTMDMVSEVAATDTPSPQITLPPRNGTAVETMDPTAQSAVTSAITLSVAENATLISKDNLPDVPTARVTSVFAMALLLLILLFVLVVGVGYGCWVGRRQQL